MNPHSFSELQCPQCGRRNALFTSSLPEGELVHCSRCRTPLGRWDGMVMESLLLAPDNDAQQQPTEPNAARYH